MESTEKKQNSFMLKLATFIVDKRSLIFLIVIIGIIFSAVAANWVTVENDLTAYLPADSSTKIGLDVMEREFITYGTANFMVGNISYEEAETLYEEIKQVEGVQMVDFNNTTEHYNQASALFSVLRAGFTPNVNPKVFDISKQLCFHSGIPMNNIYRGITRSF